MRSLVREEQPLFTGVELFNKMRPDDPIFNIKLVEAIEKNPCIWNWNIAEYSDKHFVEHTWIDIARQMAESVGNCRHRWKIIREGFAREQRHVRSRNNRTSTSKKQKPYYLAKYLEYLIPFSRKGSEIKKQNLLSSSNTSHTVNENSVNEIVDQFEPDVDIQKVDSIVPDKPMKRRYGKCRLKGLKSSNPPGHTTIAHNEPVVYIQNVDSIVPVQPMETKYKKSRQKSNKSFTTTTVNTTNHIESDIDIQNLDSIVLVEPVETRYEICRQKDNKSFTTTTATTTTTNAHTDPDVYIHNVDSIVPVQPMETRYEKSRQKSNKSFTTTAATKDTSPKPSKSAPMKRKLSTTAQLVESDCNEQQVKTKPDKIPDIDGNQLFMDSILPDLQNMTRKQNRKFRQKILALIDEILENDADRRFREKFIDLVNDVVDDGDNQLRQKVISLMDGILDGTDAPQGEV